MEKKIIIWGSENHARYTIDIVEKEKKYIIECLYDPIKEDVSELYGYPILGKDYEADIVGDRIYVRMGENVGVSYKIFEISNQSGALIQGKNIIEKKEGEVHLNNP